MKINEIIVNKFKINEDISNQINITSIEEKEKVFNYIKEQCSDFLNEVKGAVLYRGLKNVNESGFISDTYDLNRKPRNSDPFLQKMFDNELVDLGAIALRKNSIYVTPDLDEAIFYGGKNIYCIYPLNGFHYTWSGTRKDIILCMYDALYEAGGWLTNNIICDMKKLLANADNKTLIYDLNYLLVEMSYAVSLDFIRILLQKYPEIIKLLKKYYLDDTDNWFSVNKTEFKKKFDPQIDIGLTTAISNMHEIWLHGKYVAINRWFTLQ